MEVIVGVSVMILGSVLRVLAGLELKRAGLSLQEMSFIKRPPRIAQEGVYRYLRHPAYLGSLLIITGAGLACLGWGGAVLCLPAWPFFRDRELREERILKEMNHA